MPLGLLLTATLKPLMKGLARLNPWARLVELEQTLIDRARGAFLVHWFGSRLPLSGRSLLITIANLEHLQRRYTAVKGEYERRRRASLLEPIAGIAGTLAGAFLSPTGLLALLIATPRKLYKGLGEVLKYFGLLLGASVLTGIAGPAPVYLILQWRDKFPGLVALVDFMQPAADFSKAFRKIVDLLTGPRDRVRNPFLRALLEAADLAASLTAEVLGALAVVIVDIYPALKALPTRLEPYREIAKATFALVGDCFDHIHTAVDWLVGAPAKGKKPAVKGLVGAILEIVHGISAGWKKYALPTLRMLGRGFRELRSDLKAQLEGSWTQTGKVFRGLVEGNPLVRSITMLVEVLAALKETDEQKKVKLATRPEEPVLPEPPSTPPFPDLEILRPKRGTARASSTTRAGVVVLDTQDELLEGLTPRDSQIFEVLPTFDLPERKGGRKRRGGPRSVFGKQRRELEKRLGQGDPLAAARAQESRLRRHVLNLFDGLLAPAVRKRLPDLVGVLLWIDAHLYGDPDAVAETWWREEMGIDSGLPAPVFPVQTLDEGLGLRPVVRNLRVRVKGATPEQAAAFREQLEAVLREQDYAVLTPR
jgi:hypothetical protein